MCNRRNQKIILKDSTDRETLVSVYNSFAQPHFDYCYEQFGIHLQMSLPEDCRGFRPGVQG